MAEGGFLFAPDSTEMALAECGGSVVPYGSRRAVFEKPLIKTEKPTGIRAHSSGRRSALLQLGGSRYKIKGSAPSNEPYDNYGTPVGGQRIGPANAELNTSGTVRDYGSRHGIDAPMEPVCRFDYGIKFQGNDISAPVLKVRGDMRLSHFYPMFIDRLGQLSFEGVYDAGDLRDMANRLGEWLGFWYGALEKSGLCWGTVLRDDGKRDGRTNVGMHNVTFYHTKGGIGAGFVDLDESCATDDVKKRFEIASIHRGLEALEGGLYFLENGSGKCPIANWVMGRWVKSFAPPSNIFAEGFDPYDGVPELDDFESVDRFERCRQGSLPRPIDEGTFYSVIGASSSGRGSRA